eukprot:TRINITY_DN11797_c1_g1_i1.p1 TRINITY_DN11797_c1_g1~~TRINITY_DN11797_c1_g1_i1.p1  ORF type:complete len:115 (-),score=3.64 TRINITY_DN11797_c1_g1_i1:2162-2506(-)
MHNASSTSQRTCKWTKFSTKNEDVIYIKKAKQSRKTTLFKWKPEERKVPKIKTTMRSTKSFSAILFYLRTFCCTLLHVDYHYHINCLQLPHWKLGTHNIGTCKQNRKTKEPIKG